MPAITPQDKNSHLGYGPRSPLRRVGSDYEHAGGARLVMSSIQYILMTRGDGPLGQGERPWDTEFGSQLHYLKHETLDDDTLRGVVEHYVVEALARHEPRVLVREVRIEKTQNDAGLWALNVSAEVALIEQDNERNDVRLGDPDVVSVSLPL